MPAMPRAIRTTSDTAQIARRRARAPREALAQDERILGADGDDEGQAEACPARVATRAA